MILDLMIKRERNGVMIRVMELELSSEGIRGGVVTPPLRHLLIVPASSLRDFNLQPGDLRENVVLDDSVIGDLHACPSGTVLQLGQALVRLTFHCEPCARVAGVVAPRKVIHRRGYLASVIRGGRICVGDSISRRIEREEAIPYDVKERISWFLERNHKPIRATELVWAVGLSRSYCRALPALTKDMPTLQHLVSFGEVQSSDRRPKVDLELGSQAH